MPWPQYYELLKRAEARCLAEQASRPAVGSSESAEGTIPGATQPWATPSTWLGEVRRFAADLRQMATELPERLGRWLLPESRGDP